MMGMESDSTDLSSVQIDFWVNFQWAWIYSSNSDNISKFPVLVINVFSMDKNKM